MRKYLSTSGFAWVSGLTSRTSARRVDDDRFTDDEILTVVRAGESGMKLADLCQATGITVETYYAWKARYSGLTAPQLREQRQRTRQRTRRLTMLACAVAVTAVGVGVGGLMITRRSDAAPFAPPVVPNPPNPVAAGVPVSGTKAPESAQAAAVPPTVVPQVASAAAATAVPAAPVAAITSPTPTSSGATREATASKGGVADAVADPNAYSVQVAAMPDLQQARAALEKLAAAGYPAHITTKAVNRVEMYRVRVGPLATRAAAEQAAVRLTNDGYTSPWVTR